MQRVEKLVLGLLLCFCFASFLSSCGDADLLDKPSNWYKVDLSYTDTDEEGKMTIDIAQVECDDRVDLPQGSLGPEVWNALEPYTDVFADVTITVAPDAPGITLVSYTIEYFPEESQTGIGLAMPPDLDDLFDQGYSPVVIESGGSATFSITCMTVDTKDEFWLKAGWTYAESADIDEDDPPDGQADYFIPYYIAPAIQVARYTLRINLNVEDEGGETWTISKQRTIYISNYDNC